MNRLRAIDGLRTIAVLGVLWAHIWMFYGSPSFFIWKIDLPRIISFFGTGVDLFFVISGFCMYLMYVNKQKEFNGRAYFDYIIKRWKRIAPAFYAAIIVYALFAASFRIGSIDGFYMLRHALFIKNFFAEKTQYAPHFWSLCTEWHFYLVLPLLVWAIHKLGFQKAMVLAMAGSLLFRAAGWYIANDPYNVLDYSIPNRLAEFLMGIIAAKLYLAGTKKWWYSGLIGLCIGVVVAFTGRLLMTESMVGRTDLIGHLSRVFNLPMLTLGYAIVTLNCLQNRHLFARFLETNWMNTIGKYSYSMYLWHWIIAEWLTLQLKPYLTMNAFWGVNIVFIASVIILYPVSMLSYKLFESFYFNKRKPATVQATASSGSPAI